MNLPDIRYGLEPTVTICADDGMAVDRCREAAWALGARVNRVLELAEAAAELTEETASNAVLVDVIGDGGDALAPLFDRLNLAAEDGRHPSVVGLPLALIDLAAARAPHADVVLLCDPDPVERTAALGVALSARPRPTLREKGSEPPMQLRQLSEEVGRIARALAQLTTSEVAIEPLIRIERSPLAHDGSPNTAALRALIRARRLREQYFHHELFADPAWDMLLDLMLARLEQRPVAVSSLCIAAAVPPTTALRWIKRLTDEGIFVRTADPRDGRRVFIDLSDSAAVAMANYLQARERIGAPPC